MPGFMYKSLKNYNKKGRLKIKSSFFVVIFLYFQLLNKKQEG